FIVIIDNDKKMEDYELIIVGSGPAGLSAGLTASYFKLKTLIMESGFAGGALTNQYPWKVVDNCIGFKDMKGAEIADQMVEHIKAEGVEIKENETVTDIKPRGESITITTGKSEYSAKSVILTLGLGVPRKLGIPGENLDGVIYSLPRPENYAGKKALVTGGGDSAVESAMALQKAGADTTIIHRKDVFRASEENTRKINESGVTIKFNTEAKEILGDGKVEQVKLINNQTNAEETGEFDLVLVSIGTIPNKEFLEKIGIELGEKGVKVDELFRTNIQGIFAAGDVVGTWKRIPKAIGEGGFAGINAFKYVKKPYWG
ncbi:MAG: NAD(P)/FAD-dependent oxidoreductase, partial [Candidatus Altiarchaeota archaeon]|nr:NAD(P)/FAD-dependent oxidoreductase [Candidatus Altiarchaeota archaeon]MBU4437679.1 NAD(P)/FAD-dependent oxidoreductase [Candidatus Altiarchaeota archaeon]